MYKCINIYIHIYIYIYIYIHTYIYIYIYIYICIYVIKYIYIYTYIYIYAYMYISISLYIFEYTYTYISLYINTYTYICTCTFIFTYAHNHIYWYTYRYITFVLQVTTSIQADFFSWILWASLCSRIATPIVFPVLQKVFFCSNMVVTRISPCWSKSSMLEIDCCGVDKFGIRTLLCCRTMPDLGVDSDLDELDSIMVGTVKVSPIAIKCKEISRTMTIKLHVEDSQPYSVLKSCKDMSTYCSKIRGTLNICTL
jgi:hypothetical protein